MAENEKPAEFPSEWHRGVYVENLQREVLGAKARLQELEVLGDACPKVTLDGVKAALKNAEGEIERLGGGKKPAAKKPAKAAAKTETA